MAGGVIVIQWALSLGGNECNSAFGKVSSAGCFSVHFILHDVRFGSKADENGPSAPGPLSDLKLTQFGVNRTLRHEGLLSGRQRKSEGTPLNSRL